MYYFNNLTAKKLSEALVMPSQESNDVLFEYYVAYIAVEIANSDN